MNSLLSKLISLYAPVNRHMLTTLLSAAWTDMTSNWMSSMMRSWASTQGSLGRDSLLPVSIHGSRCRY